MVSATTRPTARSAASSSGWSMDTLSSSQIDVFGHLHSALARRRARAHDRLARPRRQRRRAPARATSCSSPARVPGDRVQRRGRQGQEGVRRGARGRDRRAVAGPRARGRRPSGRAVAGAARTSASSQVKAEQVEDALRRIGRLDGFELEPIVPADEQWRYRNKVEFSFGTGAEGELVCGFHAPGRWNEIVPMADCKLVSERVNELREQVLAFWHRATAPWDRRDQRGFLRNLVIREGRRTGQTQVRLVTSPGKLDVDGFIDAVDADGLWWTQTADLGESTYGGETHAAGGRAAARRAARRPRLPDLARGVLPDQHRDGREALRRRRSSTRRCAGTSASSTSTRHRHDRAVDGHPRPPGDRAGDRRARGRRRDRERPHQRDPERDLLRRRRAAGAARDRRARGQARTSR